MAYLYNLPNSTNGIDEVIVQTVSAVPSFTPLFLTFVWFFVFMGGSIRQKIKEGSADIPQWGVLASLTTTMAALLFTTKAGMINLVTLGIVIGITILTGVWYFLSKGRYDSV